MLIVYALQSLDAEEGLDENLLSLKPYFCIGSWNAEFWKAMY